MELIPLKCAHSVELIPLKTKILMYHLYTQLKAPPAEFFWTNLGGALINSMYDMMSGNMFYHPTFQSKVIPPISGGFN